MNRDVAAVIGLTAVGVTLASCAGSGTTSDRASAPASSKASAAAQTVDGRFASAALIRGADFPGGGWGSGPGSRRARCREGGTFGGVRAHAISSSFTRGNVNVQQTVWVFGTAVAARAAWQEMDAPAGRACFRLQVSERVRDQDSEFLHALRLVHQRHRPGGVRRSLLTGRITRLVNGPFGPAQTQMVVKVDEIERHRGRGISTIAVVAAAGDPDPATIRSVITVAGRRLASAAGARPGS